MLGLVGLLWSVQAFAQDTGDTGTPEEPEMALEVPEGSVVGIPDTADTGGTGEATHTNLDVKHPSLLTLQKPPSLAEGVNLLPAGSLVLLRQEDGSYHSRYVSTKSFIMPEPMYDNALIQAKQLKICQPALDKITEETLQMADKTYAALAKCGDQFDVDETLIADLTGQVGSWETRALVAEDRLKQARRSQLVAWGITGGLILGASAAIVVTVAN